ncbi:MAG: hypothetical protein ACPG7E_02955 [Marinirhabdus sp.]
MKHLTAYNRNIPLAFVALFATATLFSQTKFVEQFSVGEDVLVSVNTSHTRVIFKTWNKNTVEVEAFIDGDDLSKEEKEKQLKDWHFDVLGNSKRVVITSRPQNNFAHAVAGFPNIPAVNISMGEFPEMNFDIPPLPLDLLQKMSVFNFDYDAYQKDEKKYMEQFEKQFDKKLGKDFQQKMKKWGEAFAEQWDEKKGDSIGRAWEKKMENWQKDFGEGMEQWAKQLEQRFKNNGGNFSKKVITDEHGNKTILMEGNATHVGHSTKPKGVKTIIIRMPKNSRTEIDVRHGEIKMADAVNVRATLNHTPFTANSIDGGKTLVNAAYGPVLVNDWKYGTLYLKFVNTCNVNTVQHINLIANSSDVFIGQLNDSASLTGAFGNIKVGGVLENFGSLNIVLENADMQVTLPDTPYTLSYNGRKSTLRYPKSLDLTSQKRGAEVLATGFNKKKGTGKNVTINALYSNVTVD